MPGTVSFASDVCDWKKDAWFSIPKRLDRMEKLHGSIQERLERVEKQPRAEMHVGEMLFLSHITLFFYMPKLTFDVCKAKVWTRT